MGLHLVKTQVEALGGEVAVESKPNQGATFLLYLPETVLLNPAAQ
jgi:chemotaxis protein histidine kinase CheA